MKEICCVLLAYMLIGLIFAIIHFAVLNIDENRINVAKVLFWPITTVWYIIYAIIWLINTLFLLIKHVFLSIFHLIKNFNL
jgi:hypothetical protein